VTRIRDEDRHSHFYKIIYLFTLFTFYSPVQFETDLSVNMGLELLHFSIVATFPQVIVHVSSPFSFLPLLLALCLAVGVSVLDSLSLPKQDTLHLPRDRGEA